MDELLLEYADAFGENFPLYLFMGVPEDEIKEMIQKSLTDGVPCDPDLKKDAVY